MTATQRRRSNAAKRRKAARRQRQRAERRPITQRKLDDCFPTAVAVALGLPYETTARIPVGDQRGIEEWAKRRGLRAVCTTKSMPVHLVRWVATVPVPWKDGKLMPHAVVFSHDKLLHDPGDWQIDFELKDVIAATAFWPISSDGWAPGDPPPVPINPVYREAVKAKLSPDGLKGGVLMPGWKVRTPLEIPTSTAFVAWSGFDTESGVITGDTLDDGTNLWSGAGDADDFSAASGVATRTAVSDTSSGSTGIQSGRLALAGSTAYTDIAVGCDISWSAEVSGVRGVLLRATDANNFLGAGLLHITGTSWVSIIYRSGGGSTFSFSFPVSVVSGHTYTLVALATASGQVMAWLDGLFVGAFSHPAFATGGALDDGKPGLVDYQPASTANTRTYDNFSVWVPEFDYVLHADKSLEVHSDQILREHSSGEWGRLDSTGGYPTLPPGRPSRIVIKARRNDTDELPDDVIDDAISVTCEITPRVPLI